MQNTDHRQQLANAQRCVTSTPNPASVGSFGFHHHDLRADNRDSLSAKGDRVQSSIASGSPSSDGRNNTNSNIATVATARRRVASTGSALKNTLDPHRKIEHMRREQNEVLLRVLDEERRAEENRVHFLREALLGGSDVSEAERKQLETVFAVERRAASERIVNLTKTHQHNLKSAVVGMIVR